MPKGSSTTARVLLVDDDVSVTDTVSRLLRLDGYEVWAALSVGEGLALARRHQPNAIIVDLRMPVGSVLEFLRNVRAVPGLGSTPAAVVSGDYYLDEQQHRTVEELRVELRYKPLWLNELVKLARELLSVPAKD